MSVPSRRTLGDIPPARVLEEADLLDARRGIHRAEPQKRLTAAAGHELEEQPLLLGRHLRDDLPKPHHDGLRGVVAARVSHHIH